MSKVFEIAFKLGGELTNSFKSAFNSAEGMMKTVGMAAAALGGTAALAAVAGQVMEVEDSLAKLSAQTGVYGEEMKALGDVAKNVFKKGHGESFDDVTEALMQVKNLMHNLDDGELERVTGDAMMLANTFDADVNEVARAANNLMTNFGISSEEAFDMMAKGAQEGLNFSNEMFDNLAEYAPLWSDLGFSAEGMFGTLISGSKEGVYNLDYLNDMVKEFGIRLMDGSDKTKKAMSAMFSPDNLNEFGSALEKGGKNTKEYMELVSIIGEQHAQTLTENLKKGGKVGKEAWDDLEFQLGRGRELINGLQDGSISGQSAMIEIATAISEIEDPMERTALGVELFGTKFEDLGTETSLAMMMAGESLEDFEGAMAKMNEVRFDTVSAALRGIGRTLLVDLVLPIGDAVLPYLNQLANYLQNNLPDAIEKAKSTFVTVAPAVMGIVSAIIVYKGTLATVMVAQKVFNAVQKISIVLYNAHRAAMIAYAIYGGGLQGIIRGMAAAQQVLNVTMLANPFVAVAAAVVGLGVAFVVAYKMSETFRNTVNGAFASVKNFVISSGNYIATNASTIWNGLITSAKSLPDLLSSALSGSAIGKIVSGLFGDGKGIMDGLINSIKAGFSSLPTLIAAPTIGTKITELIGSGMVSGIVGAISKFIESFKVGLSSLSGVISMIAPTLVTMGLSLLGISGPIGLLIGGVVSVIGFLYRLSQTNETVASGLASAWSSIKTAFAPVLDVLKQGVDEFASGVGPQLAQTMEVISTSIAELGPSFAELGATFIELGSLIFTQWATTVSTLTTTVLPALLQVFQTVFPLIISVVTGVIPVVIGLLLSIIPIILQLVQTIIPLILSVVQTVFPLVLTIIQSVLPIIVTLLTVVIGVVLILVQTVIPLILSVVQMVFPLVLTIIQSVLPIVATLLTTVIGVILTLAQTILPLVLSVIQMVFPIILSIIQTVIPIVVMVLQTLVAIINGVIIPAINGILAIVQFVFPYIQLVITNALAIVNGVIQAAMALLQGDWDGAWNAIKGTAETIMNNIISFFQGINLFEVGKSIINGLINGIASMGSAVVTAISGMIPEPIRGAASKLLGALPGFAEGGVVASPTLAWVGEGGDTESIIPWNNSQRSKDLWMQTGHALGMLNESGAVENMQQQIALKTQQSNNAAPITPAQIATSNNTSNNSSSSIVVQYSPQYNVQNPQDLAQVQKHAETDKIDLEARIAELMRNERRTSFGD